MMSTSSTDFTTSQFHSTSYLKNTNFGNSMPSPKDMLRNNRNQHRAGAAIYADPQDMAFAQSSHSVGMNLPELSSMEDPMFWSNLDSNMFDVFGAVSFETMTGPNGPTANPNAWNMASFENGGTGTNFDGGGSGRRS